MFFSKPVSGWTSVMVSVWLLGGFITCFIGIVGIYLSKIFSEAKRRPYSIIRNIYGRSDEINNKNLFIQQPEKLKSFE
jgi:putative glycosyltransferase